MPTETWELDLHKLRDFRSILRTKLSEGEGPPENAGEYAPETQGGSRAKQWAPTGTVARPAPRPARQALSCTEQLPGTAGKAAGRHRKGRQHTDFTDSPFIPLLLLVCPVCTGHLPSRHGSCESFRKQTARKDASEFCGRRRVSQRHMQSLEGGRGGEGAEYTAQGLQRSREPKHRCQRGVSKGRDWQVPR